MLSGCLRKESLEFSVSKWSIHKGHVEVMKRTAGLIK